MRMKYIFCLCLFILSQHLLMSQVGINTSDARGVLHIDAAGDNTAALSAAQLKNDVIVDRNGSIGAGMSVTTPQAKVDLSADNLYGAFRLSDGYEGVGKVLFGNADGYASWGMLKGIGGYRLNVVGPTAVVTNTAQGRLVFDTGRDYIAISDEADYIVMLRLTATFQGAGNRMNGYIRLFKNDVSTIVDWAESYLGVLNNQKFSTYVVLRANSVKAGDKLFIQVFPSGPGVYWTLDLANTTVFFYRV